QSVEANLHLMADRIFLTRDDSVFSNENASIADQKAVIDKTFSGIEFIWLGIYDPDGNLKTGSSVCPQSISGDSLFSDMAETANLVIADTRQGTEGLEILVGTPINDSAGEAYAYMVGSFDYGILNDTLSNINLGSNGSAFIINEQGEYMAHSDRQLVAEKKTIVDTYGANSELDGMLAQMNLGQTGILSLGDSLLRLEDGTFFSYAPVRGTLWSLVIETPKEDYMSDTVRAITTALIIAAILFIFAALYINLLATRIQRPLRKVTDRIISLAQGDLHSDVEISKTRDETQLLSSALNVTLKDINSYTGEISRVLSELSRSNLDISVDGRFLGDFIVMKESLNTIVDFLNHIMHAIQDASAQVLGTAKQVSETALQVQGSSGSQSSAIMNLKNETALISENVSGVSDNTAQVVALLGDVESLLKEGESHMNDMLTAMKNISDNSEEITKVNKFLEDISFQTNILALNAAVEASRAGAAGRGFAVVAEEVRSLAAKSGESSKRTRGMIEYSQKSIDHGSQYARQMADSISKIMEMVAAISKKTEALNEAVSEQTSSLKNVTNQIEEIGSLAAGNLASSRISAQASRTLEEQADTLAEMAGRFRLKDGVSGASGTFVSGASGAAGANAGGYGGHDE
ncbi:MAG: methyl-accepting chemotaxis protein, partial [Clostridiales Family XIII bacterium]|nr:methyl-accepting chemotaxis protein [Clostridiales Family XIII bacterium]